MHSDTHSFVVRIWHEALDSEGNIIAWRGFIDHVGSAKRLHFDDLERVVQFIREQVGLNGRQPGHPTNVKPDLD